ncbi:tetratricopeptide repeat protein [Roseivirga sp.]|uniref:tetratricopeptide repeat protein n=1 Tax=Roseivirga sp. TaxID=1964215 RepID=UPI003B8ACE34
MKYFKTISLLMALILVSACGADITREADNLYKAGKYQEAIQAYNEYIDTKPKDIKSLYNRGRAFEQIGDLESARKDFTRVLDLDINNLNANLSMGKYWYGQKDYNKAIAFFDKVIEVDGRESMAYLLKGRSLHQKADFKNARANYDLAIDFDKKNAEAFLYRGALKIVQNKKTSACNDLNRALALGAEDAKAALAKHCK